MIFSRKLTRAFWPKRTSGVERRVHARVKMGSRHGVRRAKRVARCALTAIAIGFDFHRLRATVAGGKAVL
jgi:hypothetical protein